MILAIVPARGGSKRIPGKNIAPFGGRPLLTWSIALARQLGSVVSCVVSTEDAATAVVARQAGAIVIDRPAALAGDESSIIEVLIHAAESVRSRGVSFDGVMLLQPTNPLRPIEVVEHAIHRFMLESCDSLVSVSRRQLKLGRVVDGRFVPDYVFGTQSRHAPAIFYENGLLYLTKTSTLLEGRSLTGDRVLAFETERPFDDVDIDEPIDLVVGEAILSAVRDRLSY
jgi:N-acylneuraminate cytidylyltransferase